MNNLMIFENKPVEVFNLMDKFYLIHIIAVNV